MGSDYGLMQQTRERRLAAIMFTDMVGYSAVTSRDEALAIDMLETQSKIVEPIVAMHAGRIIRTMGDGLFIEFGSALAACRAAIEIQDSIASHNRFVEEARHLLIRIGIHLGDVEAKGDDLLGEGVNIAARIEPLAEPGGICITDDVARQIRNKISVKTVDLGHQTLKNIQEPVHVHRISLGQSSAATTHREDTTPCIVVLPFANLSPEPDNEYFSDGLTDEMICALARVRALRVASRTTCFALKGATKPLPEIGRAQGADYLLEGSVRKAGNRIRVTVQLIDVKSDRPVWAERFDRELEDIFGIQDEITESIVKSLQIAISEARRGSGGVPTKSMEAYDHFLRGQALRLTFSHPIAVAEQFARAVEIDPGFARAHAALAAIRALHYQFYGGGRDALESAQESAMKAIQLNPDLAEAYVALAEVAVAREDMDEADRLFERAAQVDPRCFEAFYLRGHARKSISDFESAVRYFEMAAHIRPDDYSCVSLAVDCYEALGRRVEAVDAARRSLERVERRLAIQPREARAWYLGATSWVRLHDREKALAWGARAYQLDAHDLGVCYNLACLYSVLGEADKAMEMLERAFDNGWNNTTWIAHDPDFASIRDHPRIQNLADRMRQRTAKETPSI